MGMFPSLPPVKSPPVKPSGGIFLVFCSFALSPTFFFARIDQASSRI